nr:hypothetical protein [Kofleriaceae bacterium]
MAEDVKPDDAGAPVPKDAIDPDLVKLGRMKIKVGAITSLAVIVVCVVLAMRLGPDRRFAGNSDTPQAVTPEQVLADSVPVESYVALRGEPLIAHAVRAGTSKASSGERVVPVRGTGDRLWLVEAGDAFGEPSLDAYAGRLRNLEDLPLAGAVRDYVAANPRPVFATPAELRGGFATGAFRTVTHDQAHATADAKVAFDVLDPGAAVIVASFVDDLPDAAAWLAALDKAGIPHGPAAPPDRDSVNIPVTVPDAVATTTAKLDDAKLFASRVDTVTHHYETTWGALASSPAGAFKVGAVSVPDAQIDLVGVFVTRTIPDDAYVVIVGDEPGDYSYVLPVTIVLGGFALLFAWAFVRAVRRDWLVPTK